ncbi:peptide/nickel transport system substrate-binding protein [Natranaerovirga pectinivora]|uniref:Peptide/nickel transport system substrate-binding protein n=1 Tax=Natranaerovirga pectinivora TaxID=682400 RepID=A0A4R3MRG3_9FIRM|nr:peptide ABC transporter substrate-binding protein [Natranaerovirga pectinivora]TCT17103.1 peptide/nickel transport system substrate-binding protein [Natranaerovirga pectinivora]
MIKSKNILILLLIILSLFLVGCDEAVEIEEEPEIIEEEMVVEIPDPDFGGNINVPVRIPATLNPILNEDRSIDQFLKLVFEPLFDLDENERPIPNLVESFTIADEGNFIDIKLRENLLWHDEEPITADDIIFTFNQLQSARSTVVYKRCINNIARMSRVNELEVRIYFNQASSTNLFALLFPIIPRHYYEGKMTIDSDVNFKPLGNGMYEFDSYVPMQEITLLRNDNWYKGNPYIDTVRGVIIKDDETDTTAFEQNLVDIIYPSIFNWQNFAEREGYKVNEYTSYFYDFIGFNFNNPLLNDKNIRQAIAYGINRDVMNRQLFLNSSTIIDVPLHANSWLNNTVVRYEFNSETASELLKNSGFITANEENVLVNENNQTLTFKLIVNEDDSVKVQMADAIKEQLKNIGIYININALDSETYSTSLSEGNYDLVVGSWKLSPIPDLTFAFHTGSNRNFINYSTEQMDNLLSQSYRAYRENNITRAYNELLGYIQEELPYFSLYFRGSAVILNRDVYGELNPSTYNAFRGFEELYISR